MSIFVPQQVVVGTHEPGNDILELLLCSTVLLIPVVFESTVTPTLGDNKLLKSEEFVVRLTIWLLAPKLCVKHVFDDVSFDSSGISVSTSVEGANMMDGEKLVLTFNYN